MLKIFYDATFSFVVQNLRPPFFHLKKYFEKIHPPIFDLKFMLRLELGLEAIELGLGLRISYRNIVV